MKAMTIALVLSTVAFAGSSIYLWRALDEARARAAELDAASANLNKRLAELERAQSYFAQRRFEGFDGNTMMAPGVGPPHAEGPPPPPGLAGKSDHVEATIINGPRPDRLPGFQKMMQAQLRANNKHMYADIGDSLHLSKADADKLVELLSEQQMRGMTLSRENAESAEPRSQEEMMRAYEEIKRQNDAEISDLIGADKVEGLKKYQESMPARGEIEMIARQLDGTDAPLSDSQRKQLITVMTDERTRVPMPEYYEGIDMQQYQKDVTAWQSDYNERVSSQARGILNTEQYNAYNDYQQWQTEMRNQFSAATPNVAPARLRGLPGGGPNVVFATPIPAPPPPANPARKP